MVERLRLIPGRIHAYVLGIREGLQGADSVGLTWIDDQSKNESYDAGRNVAEVLQNFRHYLPEV